MGKSVGNIKIQISEVGENDDILLEMIKSYQSPLCFPIKNEMKYHYFGIIREYVGIIRKCVGIFQKYFGITKVDSAT